MSLVEMFEAELAERKRRRAAGLPVDISKPVRRVNAHTHIERPGIDQSIPESERRESREPGEEG